ncbi:MAG: hypothetical protein JKY27_05645 [Magnetovibrio sp.]|nr:hypothetical protein [Magnetovibrio sp.]
MTSTDLETLYKNSTLINAKGAEGQKPVVKLKKALKKALNHTVFSVHSTDKFAGPKLRDFCKTSGNLYVGVKHFNDFDIHYVKKRVVECQRCSNIRTVGLGLAAIGTLAYTAPDVVTSTPSAIVTILFAVALASLAASLINNLNLLKRAIRKIATPTAVKAAE